jgi:hypothetical protein
MRQNAMRVLIAQLGLMSSLSPVWAHNESSDRTTSVDE